MTDFSNRMLCTLLVVSDVFLCSQNGAHHESNFIDCILREDLVKQFLRQCNITASVFLSFPKICAVSGKENIVIAWNPIHMAYGSVSTV